MDISNMSAAELRDHVVAGTLDYRHGCDEGKREFLMELGFEIDRNVRGGRLVAVIRLDTPTGAGYTVEMATLRTRLSTFLHDNGIEDSAARIHLHHQALPLPPVDQEGPSEERTTVHREIPDGEEVAMAPVSAREELRAEVAARDAARADFGLGAESDLALRGTLHDLIARFGRATVRRTFEDIEPL